MSYTTANMKRLLITSMVLGLCLGCSSGSESAGRITHENFRKLQLGQHVNYVYEILGEPTTKTRSGPSDWVVTQGLEVIEQHNGAVFTDCTWSVSNGGGSSSKSISARFLNSQLVSAHTNLGPEEEWIQDTRLFETKEAFEQQIAASKKATEIPLTAEDAGLLAELRKHPLYDRSSMHSMEQFKMTIRHCDVLGEAVIAVNRAKCADASDDEKSWAKLFLDRRYPRYEE
jgi:hypothetical protein